MAERCVAGGVKHSPDDGVRFGGAGVTLFLVTLVVSAVFWTIGWGQSALVDRPVAQRSGSGVVVPAFAGASEDRIFLTAADSREAARKGLLPAGTRSVLATGGKLQFGQWRWDDRAVPAGPVTVRADLKRQLVSVFRGHDEIGTAVVVYGIDGKETPRGKLPILGKSRDYHSITYDAPMPYSLWLRSDGVAIHGSTVSMGKATNGCIGVPVAFAEKLFEMVEKGDIVEVVG